MSIAPLFTLVVLVAAMATPRDRTPRAVSPQQILAHARTVSGAAAWRGHGVVVLKGIDHTKGLAAPWRVAIDLSMGRMNETVDYGLFRSADVWDGNTRWQQGRSGGVHPLNSAFARSRNATDAWLTRRGYLHPDALGAALASLGRRTESKRTYEVLRATPRQGQDVELWFDVDDGHLARTVQILPTSIRSVRYQGYHTARGFLVPSEILIGEGSAASAESIHVTEAEFAEAGETEFARPRPSPDYSFVGARATATASFTFDGFVAVDAMLNGNGPFTFILDTGGHAILTPAAAGALGLKGVGGGIMGGAGGGTRPLQYARVERLRLGDLTVRGLVFAIVPLDYDTVERGGKARFAGILGLELFERFAVRVDYAHERLVFTPFSVHRHSGGGKAVPIVFEEDMPLLRATIDGSPGEIAIDTGNPEPLVAQGIWADRHGLKERLSRVRLKAFGGVGGEITLWAGRSDVEMAGVRFPHVVTYYAEDKSGALSSRTTAAIAGNALFSAFTLDIDYLQGVIWFDPVKPPSTSRFDRVGLVLYKERQEAFLVGSVIEGSPAQSAGLRVGDAITAVDGTPAAELSGFAFQRMVRGPLGTRMAVSYERDGKPGTATLVLRELLP